MAEATDPGVSAPPADPAAPAAPAPTEPAQPPTGSEPVINASEPEQTVPFDRFQKANDRAKEAEERATRLEQELEASQTPPPPNSDDSELDPDVEKLLDAYKKKHGLVSQDELAAERASIQVQQDINDLTANPPNPGIAYDNKDVMDYAKANNLPVTSKAALRAAYRELNYDKIVAAERQRAIEGYRKAGSSGAELPGSGGPTPPEEPELKGKTAKERTRERIHNARQKLAI